MTAPDLTGLLTCIDNASLFKALPRYPFNFGNNLILLHFMSVVQELIFGENKFSPGTLELNLAIKIDSNYRF